MKKTLRNPNWGGKREGAGRPRSNRPRCACGEMTLDRAIRIRHKCKAKGAR